MTTRTAAATQPEFQIPLFFSKPPRSLRQMAAASAGSIAFHAIVLAGLVWATLHATQNNVVEERVTFIQLEPEKRQPEPLPPPPLQPRSAEPVMAEAPAQRGFQVLTAPVIVPPDVPAPDLTRVATNEADYGGVGAVGGRADGTLEQKTVTAENVDAAPTFTPFTTAPELINREEIAAALKRFYPKLLRDSGVGGEALVWFLVDENGKVLKAQIKETSGYAPLDDAALQVGELMQFKPARNRDRIVKVWVSMPVRFSVR